MPQMSPIWWSTLFMVFILSYIIVMMMMYFFNIYTIKTGGNSTIKTNDINWKW